MIARLDQRTKQLPVDTSRWFPAFGPGRTARPANFCQVAPLTISNGARDRDWIVAQWILENWKHSITSQFAIAALKGCN